MSLPPPKPEQARIIWTALTGLALATLVGLVVGLIWGVGKVLNILSPVLWPLAIAGVLAYLLDPVVDWLERKWMSRRMAILTVFAVALLILGGLLASVVPQLFTETQQLASKVPVYAQRLQDKATEYIHNPPQWVRPLLQSAKSSAPSQPRGGTNAAPVTSATNAPGGTNIAGTNLQVVLEERNSGALAGGSSTNKQVSISEQIDSQTLQSAGSWAATALPKAGKWLLAQLGRVASWFGAAIALALVPIYVFYLLNEKKQIQGHWTEYLPVADSRFKDEVVFVLDSANSYMIAFFRGQVLVAICDGIMYTIGFLIIGLPYAVLLGVVSVFLTLIPFLGAIITCAAALLLALAQYGDWLHPALVLVVFAIAQGLEGFVIAPKILGDKVGLHPLTIIIAVMVGTTLLGGILGGILAIPLTALLRVVMGRYVWKREVPAPPGG